MRFSDDQSRDMLLVPELLNEQRLRLTIHRQWDGVGRGRHGGWPRFLRGPYMGWRERGKPEGTIFYFYTQPLRNIRARWISQYQEKRLYEPEFVRLKRSPARLYDGWKAFDFIKLQRTWKRYRKTRFKPKEI